jgi:two-component system chemotaxis sensor kinase CheA
MDVDPLVLEIVAGFVPEAAEICEKIAREILELEAKTEGAAPAPATYKHLARGLHTLKGTAATLGLEDLSALAHAMEDVVSPLQKCLTPIPIALADALLRTLDVFGSRLRAHAEGGSAELPDVGPTIEHLRRPQGAPPAAATLLVAVPPAPVDQTLSSVPAQPSVANPSGESPLGAGAGASEATAADDHATWRVNGRDVFVLLRDVERLREMRLRMVERRRLVDSTLAAVSKLTKVLETGAVYDQLTNVSRALKADGDEIGEIVESLEHGIKTICTLPLRTLVEPLHRSVRDLCRSVGKEATLSVVGADLSIDRRILEALKGPLVHLIRNAIDHGVEFPAIRVQRGKHRAGALVVRVEQQGNRVVVDVSDDGAGIDGARICEVAAKRGLFAAEELSRMTPAQVARIIFHPGFSTRAEVSNTSGRGVGMDVVLNDVQLLGGTVDVQSTFGEGTRFLLMLPAELGTCPILLIRCGEHAFGLPLLAVDAVVAARRELIRASSGSLRLEHRGELLQLRDLGHLLRLREAEMPSDGQPVLIVQAQGSRVALAVDEVVGDREQVVHPLPEELAPLSQTYRGAAIQGFGELLLVLQSEWIVASSHDALPEVLTRRRALVVDDSVTARSMHRAMLEAGGYTVHAVGTARGALEQVRHSTYDVIVCDIAMEEMDGIALMTELRILPGTSSIPIMLVSMSDSLEERARGLAAGADGFLSKKDCASGRLLAEITNAISRRQAVSA